MKHRRSLQIAVQSLTLAWNSAKKSEEVVVIGYGTAAKETRQVLLPKWAEAAWHPSLTPTRWHLCSQKSPVWISSTTQRLVLPLTSVSAVRSVWVSIKPAYIIDGIFSDNMDFVNLNEIESVEILKDPSSLAVFGVKAPLVPSLTTKKAKAGQININSSIPCTVAKTGW